MSTDVPHPLTFVLEGLAIVIRAALHSLILSIIVDDKWLATATTLVLHRVRANRHHLPNLSPVHVDRGHTLL